MPSLTGWSLLKTLPAELQGKTIGGGALLKMEVVLLLLVGGGGVLTYLIAAAGLLLRSYASRVLREQLQLSRTSTG